VPALGRQIPRRSVGRREALPAARGGPVTVVGRTSGATNGEAAAVAATRTSPRRPRARPRRAREQAVDPGPRRPDRLRGRPTRGACRPWTRRPGPRRAAATWTTTGTAPGDLAKRAEAAAQRAARVGGIRGSPRARGRRHACLVDWARGLGIRSRRD
jgi:hypothetical protein